MDASDVNLYRGTARQVKYWVQRALLAGLIPMVQGSPGIGKSSMTRELAKGMNLKLIDDRVSTKGPEHFTGLPDVSGDKVIYKPMSVFPLEGDPLPLDENGKPMAGWLYFMDEFNSGLPTTLIGAYKLMAEKEIEQTKLHPKVFIVAAGNRDEDRAITQSVGTALQRRLLWLEMYLDGTDKKQFNAFMEDVAIPGKWHPQLISFLYYQPKYLNNFDPSHTERTFSCPATLEGASNLLYQEAMNIEDAPLFCGQLGHSAGMELVNFCMIFGEIPKYEDIIKDPLNAAVPTDAQKTWATVSMCVSNITKDDLQTVADYISNFALEFRVLFWRQIQMQHPEFIKEPAFRQAFTAIGKYLFGA